MTACPAVLRLPAIAAVAVLVVEEGSEAPSLDAVREHCSSKFAKWQLPDDIVYIDEIPKTSTGKFNKKEIRKQYADYQLPTG